MLLFHDFFLNIAHFNALIGQFSNFLAHGRTRSRELRCVTLLFCLLVSILLRLASSVMDLLVTRLCEEGRICAILVILMMSVMIPVVVDYVIEPICV